jgi:DNA-binding SARP family transcriptional activator
MLRLETLGGLVLAGDSGTPLPIQRRRLALLALLTTAGKRGVRRDKLIAFLWPDSPEAKAKHALEQLIYSLRQERDEPLVAGPDPLRINHHVLTVDVAEFTAAIERGDRAEAVRLYRGAFLDGFYLSGAPEFEAWAETERGRLAGMYREALERLAREQAERHDLDAAIESWRRLVTADPLSTSATLGLMRGLVARGDRSGAWQQGKAHEGLMRKELDRDPDVAVRALLTELGTGSSPS